MTIARKLVLGFGAVVALSALLGVIALVRLKSVSDALTAVVIDSLPGTYSAGRLAVFAEEERAAMLAHLASSGTGQRDHFEVEIAAQNTNFVNEGKSYETTITTAADREIYSRISPTYQNFMRIWAKIEPLSRAGKGTMALAMWQSEAVPIFHEWQKTLEELAKFNKTNGEANGLAATAAAARGLYWILTVLISALLTGGGIAFLIIKSTTSNLSQAVNELGRGAEEVTNAAAQISVGSQSLAQGTSEQAAALEETSASSQQMAAMTKKNADSSSEAASLMSIVDKRVVAANQTLAEMVISMGEITTSSDKISKIIKVIDEIAFQTNILALNAAVEAARAGEAGMGFAVVAEEVRNLAQRSAQAAKDTATLIEESIGRSGEGRTKLGKVEEAIRSITESSQKVKALVDDVNLSSSEQARGSEQIANAITQMEQVTQQAAASAEQSAAAGEQMAAQAKVMLSVIGGLRAMVEGGNAPTKPAAPKAGLKVLARKTLQKPAYTQMPARPAKKFVPAPVLAAASKERDSFPMDDDFKEF